MRKVNGRERAALASWSRHDQQWRRPLEAMTCWSEAGRTDPRLLRHRAYGAWWETLSRLAITLIVTREYEHLVLGVTATRRAPQLSFMPLPHPSGVAAEPTSGRIFVASTRNPNQVYEFSPVAGRLRRLDFRGAASNGQPLVPVASHVYPGCLYLHDLAFIGGSLHGNAVGQNAVARLDRGGSAPVVWWPRCIERNGTPVLGRNHLQLNSIAAGRTIEASYFSASASALSSRRPGDPLFQVDRRGVIFSGRTREVVTRGLTRPHSARLHHDSLWVGNSGYGELCRCELPGPTYSVVAKLPGWVRGLCFRNEIAFVGTSRILPRFGAYAPGLDPRKCVCGIHAVDTRTGTVLGGLVWPSGNQIFAVECVDRRATTGFPIMATGARALRQERALFYAFDTSLQQPEVGM